MNEEELLKGISEIKILTSVSNNWVEDLYNLVDKYVKDNFLYEGDEFDKYYFVYNGVGYETGYFNGPETLYYIRVNNQEEVSCYMNYDDIKNNIITEKQNRRKEKINTINNMIGELRSEGMSLRLIRKAIRF